MLWFWVQPRVQFPSMAWAAPNFTAFKLLRHWKRQVTNVYYALEAWRKQRKDQIFPRDKPNSYKFRRDTPKGERNHPCKFEVHRNIPIDFRDLSPGPYGGDQWPTHPLSGLCVGHCFGGLDVNSTASCFCWCIFASYLSPALATPAPLLHLMSRK